MPLLPYCVFTAGTKLPEIMTGVQQSAPMVLEEAGISALYSDISALPSDPGELAQAAMSYQSTVQQVFGAGVVIPFRFPTLLQSESELRTHLRDNASRYTKALRELAGLAQMEIRLSRLGSGAPTQAQSGTEYLKARQAESISFREAIASLRQAAGDLVRDWTEREQGGVTRAYALISHDAAPECKRRLGFVRLSGGARAVISGPWPPSEFVRESK